MSEEVNIFDPGLEAEQVELGIDTEADAFDSGPPPPDGLHVAAVTVINGEKGWQEREDKNGNKYYACDLEDRIINPADKKLDDRPVRDNFVSTMVMRSTGTCAVAGVLKALRAPLDSKSTALALARQLTEVTRAEPKCRIETKWVARGDTGEVGENGKNIYKDVLKGMRSFPTIADGDGREVVQHVVHWNPQTGRTSGTPFDGSQEVRARAEVVRYLPLEEP